MRTQCTFQKTNLLENLFKETSPLPFLATQHPKDYSLKQSFLNSIQHNFFFLQEIQAVKLQVTFKPDVI